MVLMKKITQHLRLILIGVGGVATISVNPNTRSTGAATITINPARHTSKTNVIGRVGEKFGPKILVICTGIHTVKENLLEVGIP